MPYIPCSDDERDTMLEKIGVASIEELFSVIPESIRLEEPLAIPEGLSESETLDLLADLAAANHDFGNLAFAGAGIYRHVIPAAVDAVIQKGEYLTAYTPYQAEASQGTLQTIFEFQSLVALLTGMDVANASLYDGATATAEAALMMRRINPKRNEILIAGTLHPHYKEVVETYLEHQHLRLIDLPIQNGTGRIDPAGLAERLNGQTAGVIVQSPNFLGIVENLGEIRDAIKDEKTLFCAVATEPLSMALLKPPGHFGADIVVGELQSFGIPVSSGGPALGFMAARENLARRIPGRIVGETTDKDGRRGFVLTLATREQHIRREKATSNICTNQGLCALAATVYMSLLGKNGLYSLARANLDLATYAVSRLTAIPRVELAYSGPSFNEFALKFDISTNDLVERTAGLGVIPGTPLGRFRAEWENLLLVAVTEANGKRGVDRLVDALAASL